MENNPALYKALVQHLVKTGEGLRKEQYRDTKGLRTIGYGYNQDDPSVKKVVGNGRTMTQAQAETLLPEFIARAEKDARSYVGPSFDKLSDERRAVLVDMSYNLGADRLGKFTGLKKALLAGNYEQAGKEIVDSQMHRELNKIRNGRPFEIRTERNSNLMAGRTMARFKKEQ